jgi:hypothetical protein
MDRSSAVLARRRDRPTVPDDEDRRAMRVPDRDGIGAGADVGARRA